METVNANLYRKEFYFVYGVVQGIYENLESGYETLEKFDTISLKYDKIIEELNSQDSIRI
ncbi:MAG: hypothetical protein ACFFA0_09410 [Promethearchaeota archaeon]